MTKIIPHAVVLDRHREGDLLLCVSGTATYDPCSSQESGIKSAEAMTKALREALQVAVAHGITLSDEPQVFLVDRPVRNVYVDYDEEGNGIGLPISMLPPEFGVHVEFLGVKV